MELMTKRLYIRPFEKQDWLAVYEYVSLPGVMAYMPTGVLNETEVKKLVDQHSGHNAQKHAIVLKEENRLIGHIEFFRYFGTHTYEIGWVLNPKYQNKGYTTEAAKAVVNYGFEEMRLHRIVATCQPENIPSWKVMEKVGMRREGLFKKCIPHGEQWWDEYAYGVLAEEWQNK